MKNLPIVFILVVAVITGIALAAYKSQTGQSLWTPPGSSPSTMYPVGNATPAATSISLTISSPSNKAKVGSANITVRGTTAPGAEVFVNDNSGMADSFGISTSLDEGDNVIVVVAHDADGNSAEKEITVTYEPGV